MKEISKTIKTMNELYSEIPRYQSFLEYLAKKCPNFIKYSKSYFNDVPYYTCSSEVPLKLRPFLSKLQSAYESSKKILE